MYLGCPDAAGGAGSHLPGNPWTALRHRVACWKQPAGRLADVHRQTMQPRTGSSNCYEPGACPPLSRRYMGPGADWQLPGGMGGVGPMHSTTLFNGNCASTNISHPPPLNRRCRQHDQHSNRLQSTHQSPPGNR